MYVVADALIFLPCFTKGHIGHPLQLFIPGRLLLGLEVIKGETLVLIILSLILGARLSQSQSTWQHCGQEICIESQEISVNIHVFDLVASQMSDIK